MGILFGWLSSPPEVAQEDWTNFLNSYTWFFLLIVLLTVVGIVLGYRAAAQRFKIFRAADVFRSYTPMRWLLLSLAGAVLSALVAVFQFHASLNTWAGAPGFASVMFLLTAVLSAVVSYVLIVGLPGLTPPPLRYRPAPYLHKTPTR